MRSEWPVTVVDECGFVNPVEGFFGQMQGHVCLSVKERSRTDTGRFPQPWFIQTAAHYAWD